MIPAVIATNGQGVPVVPVEANAPAMVIAENGQGMPIVIATIGQPYVISGLPEPEPE